MPKVDAVAELAEKLLSTLQEMRTEPAGYPPTLDRLSARADPSATAEQVKKALGKKPFAGQMLLASKKHQEAPIALAEDLEVLASSPALLEFALSQLCSAEKPLVPLPRVVGVVEKALRPAFQATLEQQARDNHWPACAGSQTVKGKPQLFLKRYPPPLSPPAELAGRLVEALKKRKAQGTGYPATLDELKQEVEPQGGDGGDGPPHRPPSQAPLFKQALSQDLFVRQVLRPVPTRTNAPVTLVEDRDLLAGSDVLLEYLLAGTTTARKPLATVSHLNLHLFRDLQQPFEEAVTRRIAEGRLPASVGLLRRDEQPELYLVSQAPAPWVLGQKMLLALRNLANSPREGEPNRYPPTLEQLAGGASPQLVRKALADKAVKESLVVAIPDAPASPVIRVEDRETLAGSPVLLHRLLQVARTPESQALALADLSRKLDRTLRYTFETTLERQLESNQLPSGVGCVKIRKVPYLFLLEDLANPKQRTEAQPTKSATPLTEQVPAMPTEEFDRRFSEAFDRLNRQRGNLGLVSLAELRRELGVERGLFDRELQRLRRARQYTLQAAEGRHPLTEEERQAGLLEDGSLLLFVSRRD